MFFFQYFEYWSCSCVLVCFVVNENLIFEVGLILFNYYDKKLSSEFFFFSLLVYQNKLRLIRIFYEI